MRQLALDFHSAPLPEEEQRARARNRTNQERSFEPVAVRVPEKVLPKVLQTGDIRSQHDTNSSMGYLNPSHRMEAEIDMGFDDHPVYGYIDESDPSDLLGGHLRHYGNVKFEMKNSVKDRTTILEADSLPYEGYSDISQPVPVRNVQQGERLPHFMDAEAGQDIDGEPDFIEAQIHSTPETANPERRSRVPLSDVHSATIEHLDRRVDNFSYKDMGDELTSRGVNVEHLVPETREQPPLPFDNLELGQQGFTSRATRDDRLRVWNRVEKDAEGNRSSNVTYGHRRVRNEDLR